MLKSTTFKIDELLWRSLKKYALEHELSMARVINAAIEYFLERSTPKKEAKKKA